MLPPRWIRRVVLAPAVPVATLVLLTGLPVVAIAAAFASPFLPGRQRPLRVLAFVLVLLVAESLTLVAQLALWLASGFGRRLADERWQLAHDRLMRRYLGVLVHAAERIFKLELEVDGRGAGPVLDARGARRPVVVLARHAGPGDSFLLVHGLLERDRRPRVILRDTLQWAPAVDVALNRVPTVFVTPGAPPGATTAAIAQLAAGLGPAGALVLFPEGRNFTANRRLHSIARLEELGRHEEAEQAREMRHVLTPRSGGAVAALGAAPTADVVFVAHTGLEDLSSVVDLWRGLPMDASIKVKLWRVPAADVPTGHDEISRWLLAWWRRIDAWILEHAGARAVPDTVAAAVRDGEATPD